MPFDLTSTAVRSFSRHSAVGTDTVLCYGIGQIRARDVSMLHELPNPLWGPPSLLFSGYWLTPRGKAAGTWR